MRIVEETAFINFSTRDRGREKEGKNESMREGNRRTNRMK